MPSLRSERYDDVVLLGDVTKGAEHVDEAEVCGFLLGDRARIPVVAQRDQLDFTGVQHSGQSGHEGATVIAAERSCPAEVRRVDPQWGIDEQPVQEVRVAGDSSLRQGHQIFQLVPVDFRQQVLGYRFPGRPDDVVQRSQLQVAVPVILVVQF